MSAEPQLTQDQRRYLQAIFDYLDQNGTWPTFEQIDNDLYRAFDIDATAVARSLSPVLFGGLSSPWSIPENPIRLPLRVVAMCSGSKPLLDLVARVIQLAVKKERAEGKGLLSSAEVRTALNLSDDELSKLGALLNADLHVWSGTFHGPDPSGTDWDMGIGREIRQYKGATSGDELVAALPPLPKTPVVSRSATWTLNRYLGLGAQEPIPVEISDSLARFRADHPDPDKAAFIMMRFGSTPAHEHITSAIKATLLTHGLTGLRADDSEYHSDLYWNVVTYMHGCGLGVAVFERLEKDEFNPNVTLEVGYMLALGKDVCFLKDKTLIELNADLMGKLYRPFNTQLIKRTITSGLSKWLTEKGYAVP